MPRYLLSILIVMVSLSPLSAQQPPIKQGDRLTLQQCVEIALSIQPSVLNSRYAVKIREAQLGQAKAPYYPTVTAAAGFTHYDAVKQTNDPFAPSTLNNTYNSENANVALNQTIYDFGKTRAGVDVGRFNLASSRFDLDDTVTAVVNSVKLAYYGVLKAKRTKVVNQEAVNQFRGHLGQARVRYQAGTRPKYDVTKAEVDLSDAELQLINAENDLEIAWVTLNNAMGYKNGAVYDIEDNLAFQQYEIALDEALKKAYENRPDLKSLIAQKESAQKAVDLAKTDYYPSLSGNAGYVFGGSQFPPAQGWNAGVLVSMNIFQGFLTKTKIEEAQARLKSAESSIDAKGLQITNEVKTAYLNLLQARKTISNTEIQMRQAAENLELANLRYSSGLGDPLEVTDATVANSRARLANISALYGYIIARANIEKAMGSR